MGKTYLRRYTDVPALIHLLKQRKITLLDPHTWDDSNDSFYLALYREKKNLKTVLALCFSQDNETYHHWHVFEGGASGICIRFRRSYLLKALSQQNGVRTGPVSYKTLSDLERKRLSVDELPFLKRHAFEHENEFRVIYESALLTKQSLDISIPVSSIDKITLSPWIHPNLSSDLKETLRSIPGCSHLRVVRSTLISNAEWKSAGEEAR